MCGRFVRFTPLRVLGDLFDCPAPPELPARYNIAPTQPVPVVRVLRAGTGRCWPRVGDGSLGPDSAVGR